MNFRQMYAWLCGNPRRLARKNKYGAYLTDQYEYYKAVGGKLMMSTAQCGNYTPVEVNTDTFSETEHYSQWVKEA